MSWIREIVIFLCGFLLVHQSGAQVMGIGGCPNVSVIQDFEPEKYLGRWYEIEKYFAIFQAGGTCVTADYSDKGNGTIGVKNTQSKAFNKNRKSSIEGTARQVNPPEGRLEVTFDTVPFPAPYLVLDTDYENYAVVYSCRSLLAVRLSFAWILTRERQPSESVLNTAYAVFDKNNLSKSSLQKTDQTDCPEDS